MIIPVRCCENKKHGSRERMLLFPGCHIAFMLMVKVVKYSGNLSYEGPINFCVAKLQPRQNIELGKSQKSI